AVSGQVSLIVYNLLGQKVRTLVNGFATQGTYRLQWDGNNDMGQRVSSGVYLYRLESGGKRFTKRMMFLK
ncbi:MAG TPA: FlgD immunoglobulin-like domain containing protein, partial [bacterium]|nr:FlgD immunoglobulin-like domain containing protein [bacterium]